MSTESWEAVARALGARMHNHDYCEDHERIAQGLAEQCPYCEDREAYRRFVVKAGKRPDPLAGVPSVPLVDLRGGKTTPPPPAEVDCCSSGSCEVCQPDEVWFDGRPPRDATR